MKQSITIIGGYNSIWTGYLKMARELEALTGLPTVAVPLMPWHWWQAERAKDATVILERLEESLAWARRRHKAQKSILVGHSAGGLIARLYLSDRPVWSQVYRGVERVSGLVTLGSPHCDLEGRKTGWFLTDEANRLVPGTPYAHRVCYRTVAGRFVLGNRSGARPERRAYRSYSFFGSRGDVWGDGVVPLECARLTGATGVTLPDVAHSRKYHAAWYGASRKIIQRWWPKEVACDR
jgi:pimeloyl-ACP methyl ester carboxylesterase